MTIFFARRLAIAILAGAVVVVVVTPSASAQATDPRIAPIPPDADARTAAVVTAADTFIARLTEAQRKASLFEFRDAVQRVRWSNFPDGAVPRSGVRWGELDATQRSALTALLGTILSADGLRMVRDQMDADDVLKASPAGAQPPPGGAGRRPPGADAGPPPGGPAASRNGGPPPPGLRPPVHFGSDWYYVSFVGTPSRTAPWMLQFGGHHLAINATVVGPRITVSPSLTGGEPLRYDRDGKAVYIVKDEVQRAMALMSSLTDVQRRTAVVGPQRIDLVLGPGHDGQVLQPEGLVGSAMTAAQKASLLALIEARLGMLNADSLAQAMAAVRENLDRTAFAWWGSTTEPGSAYYRVTGPTVSIEYAPQDADGDATDHAHNMYRDPTNEYGAAWTSLR